MTSCFGKKKLISRFIDGDLPSDQSEKIKLHCVECANCSKIYNSYKKTQALLKECYTDAPVHHTIAFRSASVKRRLFSRYFTIEALFPTGALVVTLLLISLVSFKNGLNNRVIPSLIENSASLMNTPLGSLAYYEELDETTVQSQFTKISSAPSGAFDKSTNAQLQYPSYTSPLFYDAEIDGLSYFQVQNNSKD